MISILSFSWPSLGLMVDLGGLGPHTKIKDIWVT